MIKLKQKAIGSVHGEAEVKKLAIEFTLSFLKELLINRPQRPLIREPVNAIEFILDAEEAEAAAAVRALIDAGVLEPIDSDTVTYKVNAQAFELVKSLEGVRELFIQEEGEEAGLEKLEFILEAIKFRQLEPTPINLIAFGEAYIFDEFTKSPSLLSQAEVELYSPWLKQHLTPESLNAIPKRIELVTVLEAQQAALRPAERFIFAHARPSAALERPLTGSYYKPLAYTYCTDDCHPTPTKSEVEALRKEREKLKKPPSPQPSRAKVRAVKAALEEAGVIINDGYINIKAFERLDSLAALKVFYTSLAEREAQDELKEKRKKAFSGLSEAFIEEAFKSIKVKEYI